MNFGVTYKYLKYVVDNGWGNRVSTAGERVALVAFRCLGNN